MELICLTIIQNAIRIRTPNACGWNCRFFPFIFQTFVFTFNKHNFNKQEGRKEKDAFVPLIYVLKHNSLFGFN